MDRSLNPLIRPALAEVVGASTNRRTRWIVHLSLLAWDLVLVFIAFALSYWMRYVADWPTALEPIVAEVAVENQVAFSRFWPIILLLMLLLALLFETKGLYRLPRSASIIDHWGIILSSTITGIAVMIVMVFLYRPFFYSRLIFGFAAFNIVLLLGVWRTFLLGRRHWLWARSVEQERLLVVGSTGLGIQMMNGIATHPALGYSLVGYLGDAPISEVARDSRIYRYLGATDDLAAIITRLGVRYVILALPFWDHGKLPHMVQTLRTLGAEYYIAPDLYQISFDHVDMLQVGGVPLIKPRDTSMHGFNLALKRIIDVFLVLLSAPLSLPLALVLALLIRRDSPGPILFRQTRVGLRGKTFTCYKFRTMVPDAEARRAELEALNEADGPLFKIRHDPRITRIGRFLRRSSLDELPQLINILLGEMSIVGPRPALPHEVARYEEWHTHRLDVLPGLAGLGQAMGRSDIPFEDSVRLDIYYAENWSVAMDFRIMLMTVPVVLLGRGAY